ncbi:magnesium transporter [Scenedesmus sp. PABB004]|nr:magnesium transporter [Scenedesmus sp. PABB004]
MSSPGWMEGLEEEVSSCDGGRWRGGSASPGSPTPARLRCARPSPLRVPEPCGDEADAGCALGALRAGCMPPGMAGAPSASWPRGGGGSGGGAAARCSAVPRSPVQRCLFGPSPPPAAVAGGGLERAGCCVSAAASRETVHRWLEHMEAHAACPLPASSGASAGSEGGGLPPPAFVLMGGSLVAVAGFAVLLRCAWAVSQYRDMLKLTQQDFSGLPQGLQLELVLGTALALLGGVMLAGSMKPIVLSKGAPSMEDGSCRPSFISVNHRGKALPLPAQAGS